MEPNIQQQKAAVRDQARAEVGRLSQAGRALASSQACALLFQQPVWRQARTVLLYAPLSDELDIAAALNAALSEAKVVALLRYSRAHRSYSAYQVRDWPTDLQPGFFGVREPAPACPEVPLNQLDLTLVPGVAFSPDGGRVGRGKGFYDRLLPLVSGVKCGVAFDQQLVPAVPLEAHDVRLNCILTPTRWLQIAG